MEGQGRGGDSRAARRAARAEREVDPGIDPITGRPKPPAPPPSPITGIGLAETEDRRPRSDRSARSDRSDRPDPVAELLEKMSTLMDMNHAIQAAEAAAARSEAAAARSEAAAARMEAAAEIVAREAAQGRSLLHEINTGAAQIRDVTIKGLAKVAEEQIQQEIEQKKQKQIALDAELKLRGEEIARDLAQTGGENAGQTIEIKREKPKS